MGVVRAGGITGLQNQSTAQVVGGGLRFDDSKSQYLTRTPSSVGNRRTWTWSGWVKRSATDQFNYLFDAVTTDPSTGENRISFQDDEIKWYSNSTTDTVETSALFRDYSGWYHIVFAYNSTESTSSDRVKIYVNGILQTLTGTYPNSNVEPHINNTRVHRIASSAAYGREFGGQMSQVYLIDGQALDSSYFGFTDPLTNVWRPKRAEIPGFNDGTVWSSDSTNFTNPGQGFNGNPSNYAEVSSTAAKGTFTFPKSIQVENNVTFIYSSGTSGNLFINDSSTAMQGTSLQIQTISFTGTLSSISLQSASQPVLYYFSVDGKPLIDSVTNNFGNNGFYLPLDGSAPIGEDKSGNGNNWTPVNFGGSNTIEKATGALPILNTDGGGKVARVGVRTDAYASNLVLALPLVGSTADVSNQINSGSTTKIATNSGVVVSSTQSNFYGGSHYWGQNSDSLTYAEQGSELVFGTGDYTIEFWFYDDDSHSGTSNRCYLFDNRIGGSITGDPPTLSGWIDSSNEINLYYGSGEINYSVPTSNRWIHYAAVRSGSTVKLYVNGIEVGNASDTTNFTNNGIGVGRATDANYGMSGYIQDFRIYKGVAKYTSNFIPASTDPDIVPDSPSGVSYSSNLTQITDGAVSFDGNGDYLSIADSDDFNLGSGEFTIECYIRKTANGANSYDAAIATGSDGNYTDGFAFLTSSADTSFKTHNGSSTQTLSFSSSGFATDGVWHHIAISRDSSNIARLYLDGILQSSATWNFSIPNSSTSLYVGAQIVGGTTYSFNGFISNLHVVKGTALYTENFTPPSAPISSVENTKLLCCKSPTSATAFDVSPGSITANGNAAATNFNPFTVDIDTQRGKQSGYATLNPLWKGTNASNTGGTFAAGNLQHTTAGSNGNTPTCANTYVSSGKWYWEVECISGTTFAIGVASDIFASADYPGYGTGANNGQVSWAYVQSGNKIHNATSTSSYGSSYTNGDLIGVSIDFDSGELTFYKNGISQGVAYSNLTGNLTASHGDVGSAAGFRYNFGQKPFKFPPPPGFQPLTLANLPRPTIVRPDQYVGIVTYTGDGSSTRDFRNFNFAPDFIWYKERTNIGGNWSNTLFDTVRGNSVRLQTNTTSGETSENIRFLSDGFGVGDAARQNSSSSGANYVAWCWKAGGNSNTFNIDDVGYDTASAAGLTAGTITPTGASVNTKSGFSIIKFTAPADSGTKTISHGLSRTPDFFIFKETNRTTAWYIFHSSVCDTNEKYLRFDTTALQSGAGNVWGNLPTSNLISIQNGSLNAVNSQNIIYAWAEIPGFSKFGSFVSNGTTDNSFVFTGFRPRFIIYKRSDSTGVWGLRDTARDTANPDTLFLQAQDSAAEGTGNDLDILSNGFKIRSSNFASNATYIYAAFAEAPSINLYGAQSNAR